MRAPRDTHTDHSILRNLRNVLRLIRPHILRIYKAWGSEADMGRMSGLAANS
jgi:hypothetical protein